MLAMNPHHIDTVQGTFITRTSISHQSVASVHALSIELCHASCSIRVTRSVNVCIDRDDLPLPISKIEAVD